MRRVRLAYEGAFHHGMNRGINGEWRKYFPGKIQVHSHSKGGVPGAGNRIRVT